MSGVGARDGILVQVYLNLIESDARKCSSQVDRPECIQCVLMTTGGMCEDVSACIRTGLLLFERNSATYVPFIRSAGKSVFTTVNTQEDHVPAEVASVSIWNHGAHAILGISRVSPYSTRVHVPSCEDRKQDGILEI
jgi:hypothetical protein